MKTKSMRIASVSALLMLSSVNCGPGPSSDIQPTESDLRTEETALGESCATNSEQPSTCAYGDYCAIRTRKCASAPSSACSNFEIYGTQWNAATSTGPVIYEAKAIRFVADGVFCGRPDLIRATYRIKAYAPLADLPLSREELSERFYFVAPGGTRFNATAIQDLSTTNDARHIAFDVNLCVASELSSYTAGFYFDGGNEICATAP
jgi:hypothetical protein